MQEGKKKNEDSKKKERHIVTWSQEEDDILREQISIHGTENWGIIASKFKDKTTRQCRRRFYTYLNSDFKKGGWSPEEDMLLCEAQKVFGNRWTEIAKVVSGRTDNAVKNRFTTLCKKRAKYEALAKENSNSYINHNSKRILLQSGSSADGQTRNAEPVKRIRRAHISDPTEDCNFSNRSHMSSETIINQQLRPPFAVLVQNFHNNNLMLRHHISNVKEVSSDAQNNKIQGTFLKKDDPTIIALMEQAELLSSLALKVSTENTEGSLENAWKVLQDYLNQNKSDDTFIYGISDIDFDVEDLKDLVEDSRSSNEGTQPSWRQSDLYEVSPASSEYSTGSTLMPHPASENADQAQVEIGSVHQDVGCSLQSTSVGEKLGLDKQEHGIPSSANGNHVEALPTCDEQFKNGVVSASSSTRFSSPIQVTPLFRSLAAGIPSPTFSESERNFLLKALGVESPPNPSNNPPQPPLCKRVLLQSL